MKQIVVGIDVDGVLANFNASYKVILERVTPIRFPDVNESFPNTWHWERAMGVSPEDEATAWDFIRNSHSFWKGLPGYYDTSKNVQRLGELAFNTGIDIYFITNRPGPTAKAQTEQWLETYSIDSPTVLISGKKGLCCQALGITHYIDDLAENCLDVQEKSPQTKLRMLARPWNSPVDGLKRIDRMREFLDEVEYDWEEMRYGR